jgi:hypothetical protein
VYAVAEKLSRDVVKTLKIAKISNFQKGGEISLVNEIIKNNESNSKRNKFQNR